MGWGTNAENMSCLVPFIQAPINNYTQGPATVMQSASSPFVVSYGDANDESRTIGLLGFVNGSRAILKYQGNNL